MSNKKISLKYSLFIVLLILPLVAGQPESQQGEWDYTDENSYKEPQFYETSDPTKWNRDKIDFNNDALHKRLNSDEQARNWYLRDYLGCQQCTFGTGGQDIKYSPEGMTHPKSGLFKNPQFFPSTTKFIADQDRIVAVLPPGYRLIFDDPKVFGSATIDAKDGLLTYKIGEREVHLVSGTISIKDGKFYIGKGDRSQIDGLVIRAITNTNLFFDGKECQGCISIGKEAIFAQGRVIFRVINENKIFSVKGSSDPNFAGANEENDILRFDLGDFKDKEGKVRITTVKNSMPLVETEGFARIINDRMPLRILDKHVELELRKDIEENFGIKGIEQKAGSVPLTLVPGGSKKYYQFDESQNLYIDDERAYQSQINSRESLENNFNVKLNGYFSENELKLFEESLKKLESAYGIDTKKLRRDGNQLVIGDTDRRFSEKDDGGQYFFELNKIKWNIGDRQIKPESRIIYGNAEGGSDFSATMASGAFIHEFHHVLYGLDPDFVLRINQKLSELGFQVSEELVAEERGSLGVKVFVLKGGTIPKELLDFLPPRFETNAKLGLDIHVDELQAYISERHLNDPEWFNDPKVSPEIRQKRQEFRKVFGGFEKFRK